MKSFDRFDKDFRQLYDDMAYKVVAADAAIDVGLTEEMTCLNGNTRKVKSKALLKQRVIITFSRKTMEYQRYIRNRQIERATKMLMEKKVEDVKKGPHDVTRFIKRASIGKNGEKASDHYYIDKSIIDNEEKYDGYYAVATNLDDEVKDILAINSQRFKIEDCFRIMKTNFGARPIFHRRRTRIIAHFLICYTALLIYRLLEVRLDQYGKHFTTDEILNTLRNMNVMNVQDVYYAAAYTSSSVCTALNGLFDLGLDKKNYQPKDLNKTIKKLLK
jgi:transposase